MNFCTGRKIGTDATKCYGEGSEILVFLGKRGGKTVQKVKNYGGSKNYGLGCRSIFSTEGSLVWGVADGSSVSWVAKFKGGKNSQCKLSNGRSRSYKVIQLLLPAWKRVVAKTNQHPSLACNFITHGFLQPSALPD